MRDGVLASPDLLVLAVDLPELGELVATLGELCFVADPVASELPLAIDLRGLVLRLPQQRETELDLRRLITSRKSLVTASSTGRAEPLAAR